MSIIPVKAALAVGKNYKALDDDEGPRSLPQLPLTPQPPVAWAVVWVAVVDKKWSQLSQNSFYVFFCLIVVHISNFIQIRQKINMEVKKICYRSALVGWSTLCATVITRPIWPTMRPHDDIMIVW